jgi:hypothetical protein
MGHVGGHAVHHHQHGSHVSPGYTIPASLGQVPGQVLPGRRIPVGVQRLLPKIGLLSLIILALVLLMI